MPDPTPRYLVPFHPKHVPHFFADVLIVGGGLAGFRAALAVDPGLSVLVVTKDAVQQSNSSNAQGELPPCSRPRIRSTSTWPIRWWPAARCATAAWWNGWCAKRRGTFASWSAWGTAFDQAGDELALGREGGHSRDRIAHALGDATGKEVMRAVIERVQNSPHDRNLGKHLHHRLAHARRRLPRALVWNSQHGKTMVWAKQTILATGGAGQIYRETTNPDVATGDGMALAYRAGAELRDMEFVQFHPTVLYIAGGSRSLISEATRGEGAWLVDRHGRRFMTDYDPRGELAPRDVVSLAIVSQMERTRHPNVYLDMTHLDADRVRARFPGIAAVCAEFDLDITRDRIPVRPGAHYMMGGVVVDAGSDAPAWRACGRPAK